MENGKLPYEPLCVIRRDLPDEMGFAEFIEQRPELGSIDPIIRGVNRALGLPSNTPRYAAYYTEKGFVCITPDREHIFRVEVNPLFTAAWETVQQAANSRPLMRIALASMGDNPLEADADGRPRTVMVQDRHTGEVWLWPANEETERFLRTPR